MRALRSRRRPSPPLIISAVALFVALGGIASAAIPAPDGAITGCYTKKTGALRVVKKASACSSKEAALKWNQNGREGPAGSAGPAGSLGATGGPGPAGQAGPAGAKGERGEKGDKGDRGDEGQTGPAAAIVYITRVGDLIRGDFGAGFAGRAACAAGETATGGGFSAAVDVSVTDSRPSADGAGWQAFGTASAPPGTKVGLVHVVCAQARSGR